VTDGGNGETYSFDPAAAGIGTHTITYTFTNAKGCTNYDVVEVFLCQQSRLQRLLTYVLMLWFGNGTATGGVYSGTG
jgi:hypothetical protein